MANPRLRILIVDELHSRRMTIEKHLSALGYSRVAPLATLRELLLVIDNALYSFDLLIIHEAMLINAGEVLESSVRNSQQIKHLLVYEGNRLQAISTVESSSMNFALPYEPDQTSMRQVMNFVEETSTRPRTEIAQSPSRSKK